MASIFTPGQCTFAPLLLCVLDDAGTIVLHKQVPAEPAAFLEAVAPFRDGLVVACECLFCWYWLADLCQGEKQDPS